MQACRQSRINLRDDSKEGSMGMMTLREFERAIP
jgi:hypothetical protein